METFGIALGSGVLAALLASALWLFFLTRLRPNIHISPVIAHCADEKGKTIYRIKIINRGRRTVANVRCELDLLTRENVKGGQVDFRTAIKLRTNSLILLPGQRKKDKEFKNASRFRTLEDLHACWDDTRGHRLVFRVFAQDAVSRVGQHFEVYYNSKATDLQEGQFAFGDTFEVTPVDQRPLPPATPPVADPRHGW